MAVLAAVSFALFLPPSLPARDGAVAAPAPFQYEVLSGIREEARISDGWHESTTGIKENVWAEGWAIDFMADYAAGESVAGKRVHAVLRHVSGAVALTAYLKPGTRSCKTLLVELHDGKTHVATVEYVHTDPNPAINFDEKPKWEVPTGQTTSSGDTGALGTHISTVSSWENPACAKATPPLWTGAHLHQRVRVHEAEDVGSERDSRLRDRWIKDASGKPILANGKKQRHEEYRDELKRPSWPPSNPSWVRAGYLDLESAAGRGVRGRIDTAGGVAHRSACREDAKTKTAHAPNGMVVQVVQVGSGSCAGWVQVYTLPGWLCVGCGSRLLEYLAGDRADERGHGAPDDRLPVRAPGAQDAQRQQRGPPGVGLHMEQTRSALRRVRIQEFVQ